MKCLILVDVQNDFLPGGALPVPGGDAILPAVSRLMERFPLIAATQDWHPPGHASFASSHPGRQPFDEIELEGKPQTLWPDHCIQKSEGADFPSQLDPGPIAAIFRKGMDPRVDSYSGFFDNNRIHRTGLSGYLKDLNIREIFIAGLAAEICVAFTAADGEEEGFRTTVVEDATRPLDEAAFAEKKAELKKRGVAFARADAVLSNLGKAAA